MIDILLHYGFSICSIRRRKKERKKEKKKGQISQAFSSFPSGPSLMPDADGDKFSQAQFSPSTSNLVKGVIT